MRLPDFVLARLQRWAQRKMESRPPDFVIGDPAAPYLLRWWVIPRNRLFNIYLHRVIRSDDDRALHDHPWLNASIIVDGGYLEHRIAAGGCRHLTARVAGDVCTRTARAAHRLEVMPGSEAVTLFVTGPVIRQWGFHCEHAGWRHWKDFTAPAERGQVGRGCGEMEAAE